MAGIIDFIKDKLGNIVYPITREKAVYDDNNVRLDNKLADLPKQFYGLQGGIEIPEGADLNNPIYRQIGNYYCETWTSGNTIVNKPPFSDASFVMRVYFTNGLSYPTQEILTGVNHVYKRTYDTYLNKWNEWTRYLSTVDLVNNDTTGGTDKVLSAEVGKVLGQEIDTVNNKLANLLVLNTLPLDYASSYPDYQTALYAIYDTLPNESTIMVTFIYNSVFNAIVQKNTNNWGSIILYGYALSSPTYHIKHLNLPWAVKTFTLS